MSATRIPVLLIEDDPRTAELICGFLEHYGFDARVEPDGAAAADRILREQPRIVLLDIMLPGEDGLSICRRIRPRYTGYIVLLTALDAEIDQVFGLELGADDYVPKSASPRLLLARLQALLRRDCSAGEPSQQIEIHGLRIDHRAKIAWLDGRELELSAMELELLWTLARSAGQVLSRETLTRVTRGIDYDGLDRTIDIYVSRLRRKLAVSPAHRDRIKTVRGEGYLFLPALHGITGRP